MKKLNAVHYLLIFSVVINLLLLFVGYNFFQYRYKYIYSEEFAVIGFPHISKTFCTTFKSQYPDLFLEGNEPDDTVIVDFCREALTYGETESTEVCPNCHLDN